MKLLSIDIETTGLDPSTCHILEIGCVLFDPDPEIAVDGHINADGRKWQMFERLVKCSKIVGEPYALAMNADVIAEISGFKKSHRKSDYLPNIMCQLAEFLEDNGVTKDDPCTIVGKNFDAFDRQFLACAPGWNFVQSRTERRVLDVGSLAFSPSDGRVLGLQDCLGRIGVRDEVKHRALDDALQVATFVSRFFS